MTDAKKCDICGSYYDKAKKNKFSYADLGLKNAGSYPSSVLAILQIEKDTCAKCTLDMARLIVNRLERECGTPADSECI